MSEHAQRYAGALLGFAFAAVWIAAGLGSALACLVAAVVGFAVVRAAQRTSLAQLGTSAGSVRKRLEPAKTTPTRSARSMQRAVKPEKPHRAVKARTAEAPTYGW